MSSLDYLDLCRLCLVKDGVSVPIFEGETFLKISACLPVKVTREDKLPKKICHDCVCKVELFYDFCNTTANSEKQLLQLLGDVHMEDDKQNYIETVLSPNRMKSDEGGKNNRLEDTVMQQVSEHQNSMNIMDNIMDMPMMISGTTQQQITSVPMDTTGESVQNVPVAGPSTQMTHEQVHINQNQSDTPMQQEEEEESSEEEENFEEECDADEGLPVKEESEEDPNNRRTVEPTTFVNVSLTCEEAGPSGLQQQKIPDIPDTMVLPQTEDVDPKTGKRSVDTKATIKIKAEAPTSGSEDKKFQGKVRKAVMLKCKGGLSLKNFHSKYLILNINKGHKFTRVERLETTKKEELSAAFSDAEPRNQEALSCAKCNFRCNKRSTLIAHLTEKHETTANDVIVPDVVVVKNDAVADDAGADDAVADDVIADDAAADDTAAKDEPEFVCYMCMQIFARKETLNSHFVRKHTQQYKYSCDFCQKKFKIKGDCTTHIRLKHLEQNVICDVCGKSCRNTHSLYTHQKHAHYKPKYECRICKRRMVSQENLDRHIVTQHEKKEKTICEECGKTFLEGYDLKKHMRIHTGDKPYKCTECDRAFARHSSLSQHLLLHTGERFYKCDLCEKAFSQKAGLICHRKTHSGNLPPLPVMHIDHILKKKFVFKKK